MSSVSATFMDRQKRPADDEGAERRSTPLRDGYDWPSIALFVIFLGTFVYALLRR